MRLKLLGRAVLELDDGEVIELRPTMRNRALVYLACSDGPVTRDRLGFLFWPDVPDTTARHNVRQLLKRMRRLSWLEGLTVVGDRIGWTVDTDLAGLYRRDPEALLEPAAGELLPGFERGATVEYEEWLLAERHRAAEARQSGRAAVVGVDPQTGTGTAGRHRLVGRIRELSEIAAMVARPDVRLVTLVGPAGTGKSALGRALVGGRSPGGRTNTAFVSLESISDPDQISAQVAIGCGVVPDGRLDPLDQLVERLHEPEWLLVLDNAEHLPDGWRLFSELLQRCPELKIVVTSRQRLRLTEEWIYEVGGLSDDDAVELLIERAHQVAPEVTVEVDQALAICRQVGASPLGIELAAPWLRLMAPPEVVEVISRNVSLLTGGAVDAPARHRSVDAAMAHSWALADPDEREAVEALSVFTAPYTVQLATAVAAASPVTLRNLVDKSFIRHHPGGLLASHPLVRQYAAARLAADDARKAEARRRFAHAVVEILGSAAGHLLPSVDDASEAWRWAVEHGDTDLIERSCAGLVRLVERSGRYHQGLALLAAARSSIGGGQAAGRAAAAVGIGESSLLQRLGRHHDASRAAQTAVDAATSSNDRRRLALALVTLGWARKWVDGDDSQYAITQRAYAIAEELDDDELSAHVLNGLGCSAPTLQSCREHLVEGLTRARTSDLRSLSIVLLNNLGMVAWGLGEPDSAIGYLEEACALARADNTMRWIANSLANLAFVHGDCGDLATARRLADEAEAVDVAAEDLDHVVLGRLIAGEIRRLTGDRDGARQRADEALRLARAVGNEAYVVRSLRLHGFLLVDSGEVERGARILWAVLRRTGDRGDFTAEIQNPRLLAELSSRVEPHILDDARSWAADHTLHQLVALVADQA